MIYEQHVRQLDQQEGHYLLTYPSSSALAPNQDDGSGIPSDLDYALQLYLQASRGGLSDAMNAYAMLIEEGTGLHFPLGYSERDRMIEAAKWYHAAVEEGKIESAGNLLLLLTTYPYLDTVETVSGDQVSVQELKLWLHSLMRSKTKSEEYTSTLYEALKTREIIHFPDQEQAAESVTHYPTQSHRAPSIVHPPRPLQTHRDHREEVKERDSSPPRHSSFPSTTSSSQPRQTLYSKNQHTTHGDFPLATQTNVAGNKIFARLDLAPPDTETSTSRGRGDYLTNKLKTFSKFSLTSDLIARKMEYSDQMKWNQQLQYSEHKPKSPQHQAFLHHHGPSPVSSSPTLSSQPQSTTLKGAVGWGSPNQDFKNVSKFITSANRLSKRSSPEQKESSTMDDRLRDFDQRRKVGLSPQQQQRSERAMESKLNDDEEESELDTRQQRHQTPPPCPPSQKNSAHSFLNQSDSTSEDSDLLPVLTHQQDRQVTYSPPLLSSSDHLLFTFILLLR
jgi:hypothetical protein